MQSTTKKRLINIGAIFFWLLIWMIASVLIDQELFLPSPIAVLSHLVSLLPQKILWLSIAFSLERVLLGFFLALVASILAAIASYKSRFIEIAIAPIVKTIRAVPVASIVILLLVWISSRNLSVVISFMVVFPIIYTNVLQGLREVSPEMLEMADIYRMKGIKKVRYIYIPYVMPYFSSAVKSAIGFGFKSAIAAEVIGLPRGSIGEKLYDAKVYFSTPDLFAWTLVIIILAVCLEKLILVLSDMLSRRLCR